MQLTTASGSGTMYETHTKATKIQHQNPETLSLGTWWSMILVDLQPTGAVTSEI